MSTIEAVRKRPAMYIGGTGPRAVTNLLWEIVANSIDEHLAGHAMHIDIKHREDGSWLIEDDGRGIDPDRLRSIFTELHNTPTLDGHLPHIHAGHGVGVGVVNALSAWMRVLIQRDGKVWQQDYIEGKPASALAEVGFCDLDDTGTMIAYLPDPAIFSEKHGPFPTLTTLAPRVRELVALAKGLTITLGEQDYLTPGGLGVLTQNTSGGACPTMSTRATINDIDIDVAVSWGRNETSTNRLFVNYVNMTGTAHKLDLMLATSRVEGRHAVVSLLMRHPRFAGPTRQRLDDDGTIEALRNVIKPALRNFLTARPHLRATL